MPELFISLIFLAIAIAVLVAWIMAIGLIISTIEAKGYSIEHVGRLWFVGFFASPIVVGLYACSLPDNRPAAQKPSLPAPSATSDAPSDLPAL